jgi:DNA-binding GntR family transcriptional regulator
LLWRSFDSNLAALGRPFDWGYSLDSVAAFLHFRSDVSPLDRFLRRGNMSQNSFAEVASTALQNQKSASAVVADTIRRAILRGQFVPGQPMPQEEIAKQFKVSRAPVRDALRQLESEGLIVQHPNRGAEVAKLTTDNLQEIFLIRESLESTALRHAVPKMTDGDLAKAEEVLDRIDADPDPTHMAELNWEFHEAIYRAADLPRLLGLARTLNNNALPYHHLGYIQFNGKTRSQQGHREILAACRARHEDAAVKALLDHLRFSASLVTPHLQGNSSVIVLP